MGNVTNEAGEGLIAWYTGTGLLTDMAYITRILNLAGRIVRGVVGVFVHSGLHHGRPSQTT